jgi:hypothetical protein
VRGPAQVPSSMPGVAMRQTPTDRCGQQNLETWAAGDSGSRPLLELQPNGELWRISVVGDLLVELTWGTSSRRRLVLDAPILADLPGFVSVIATPRTSGGATGQVTATRSSGAGPQELRRFVAGPVLALDDQATRFVALAASTVTVRALAVVLAVGDSIPLVSGSVLTAGSGFVEYTP